MTRAVLDREDLRQVGFTPVRLLDRGRIRAVLDALREFGLDGQHLFFASPYHAHGPAARAFDQHVKAIVREPVARLLSDHEPFMVAATTKGRRRGQPIKFHHDWTYTDERRHVPVFFWCPLVDVDERNGTLQLVPGSHRWSTAIRPSRPRELTETYQAEFSARAQVVPVRAGEAIAFHPAILHGSGPNPTRRARPAITIAVAPIGAALVHFHQDATGDLHGAAVDESFFTTHPYGTAPEGHPPVTPWDRAVDDADLIRGLADTPVTTT